VVELGGVHGEGEPDRVRDPPPGQPLRELLRAAGPVRADQHPPPWARVAVGELRQRGLGDSDVIAGLVGAGVARPQQDLECFAGSVRAVVGERQQGVEPVPAFERRSSLLLLRMRGDQRRIQVDNQRLLSGSAVVGGMDTGHTPHGGAGLLPRRRDRLDRLVRIVGQGLDQPGHRRIRRHRPVDPWFGAQGGEVAQRITAQHQRHR